MGYRHMVPALSLAVILGASEWQEGGSVLAAQARAEANKPEQAKEKRRLRRDSSKPIDTRIVPSDKEVEIVDEGPSPGLSVVDASGKVLETRLRSHDLVALVRLTDVSSSLTADKTWVRSALTAQILELWKAGPETKGLYQVGDEFVFSWEGGGVSVAGKKVTARIPWVRDVRRGNTYLVIGWFPEGNLRISPQLVYEVVGQRIRSITTGSRGLDDIEMDTLDNVRRRVADALAKQ